MNQRIQKKKEESRSRSGSEEHIYHSEDESNDEYYKKDSDKLTEKNLDSLDTVLESSKALELFELYLDSVGSKHMLDFLKEVTLYKQLEEPAQVQERAQLIFKIYLESKKIQPDADLIQQVQESIAHKIFTGDLWNYISASVYLSLNAIFPNFKSSDIVKSAVASLDKQ